MESRGKERLINCLETILELETALRSIREAKAVLAELTSLRLIINNLNFRMIQIEEGDVLRIEGATMAFLRELEDHFQHNDVMSSYYGPVH